MKNKDVGVHQLETSKGFPMMFTKKLNKDGTKTVTGCNPNTEMLVGEEIEVRSDGGYFKIIKVNRRNVIGNYSEGVNKKDAFFECICDYTPPVK